MGHQGSAGRATAHDLGSQSQVSTVVYRSRAVSPLSAPDLRSLLETAQARNQREAITGVVLYDDNRFFQWLEGPADGVARVMSSIRHDARHTDLEVLATRESPSRRFDGWDMKLAARGASAGLWQGEVLEPPREIIEHLRRKPAAAPSLLVKLVPPTTSRSDAGGTNSPRRAALGKTTAAVLKSVFLESVIPVLLREHSTPAGDAVKRAVDPRASELAELLLASDETASLELIRELRGQRGTVRHLYAPLFEPAARSLGDLWHEDICTEVDVTLGLIRLQAAARLLDRDAFPFPQGGEPSVLVVPAPGELHQLTAALDAESLWHAGWSPQSEFPADDQALGDLLSSAWVDVLDLSLSAALRRQDSMPRLSRTIAHARQASRNQSLLVIVGGRAFAEDDAVGAQVGANATSITSAGIGRLIVQQMARHSTQCKSMSSYDPQRP